MNLDGDGNVALAARALTLRAVKFYVDGEIDYSSGASCVMPLRRIGEIRGSGAGLVRGALRCPGASAM